MPTLRLTEKGLRSLKPQDGQEDLFDTVVPGFLARIGRKGTAVFYLRYRDAAGNRPRVRIGEFPQMGLADARDRARALLVQQVEGDDPAEQRRKIKVGPTVGELVTMYLEQYAKRRKRTWKADQWLLERHVVAKLGGEKAALVSKRKVVLLLEELIADGKLSLADHVLKVVSKMFNWAREVDLVENNPATGVPSPGPRVKRRRCLNDAEIATFWAATAEPADNPVGAVLRLMLLTGQRSGEIKCLRWQDLDGDVWVIPAELYKTAEEHVVPLPQSAVTLIERFRGGDPVWVFPSPRAEGHLGQGTLSHAVRRIVERFGMEPWRPHDLRRTVATGMAGIGIDEFVIQRVLGHAYSSVTAIYNRYSYLNEKRHALERWSEKIAAIANAAEARAKLVQD